MGEDTTTAMSASQEGARRYGNYALFCSDVSQRDNPISLVPRRALEAQEMTPDIRNALNDSKKWSKTFRLGSHVMEFRGEPPYSYHLFWKVQSGVTKAALLEDFVPK